MSKSASNRVRSTMKSDEEVLWSSGTNVVPSVVSAIPGILIVGSFLGLWSGMFFGVIVSTLLGSIIWAGVLGFLAFMIPVVSLAVSKIYESSKEEFVVTDRRIITVTANRLNIDVNAYNRASIKQLGVEQNFVGDIMDVGNIKVELFQTEMETDEVALEGIDNPYDNLEKLRGILSEDINTENNK